MKKYLKLLLLPTFILISLSANALTNQDKSYVQGYVSSLFKNIYGVSDKAFEYKDNKLILDRELTGGEHPEFFIKKVKDNVFHLEQISDVVWKQDFYKSKTSLSKKKIIRTGSFLENLLIPPGALFQPLLADPNWPRFTLAYQYYTKDKYSTHVFAPNFGAHFGLLKFTNEDNSASWELGVQAGLFAIMDIGARPTALINADYYAGVPLTYSSGSFSQLIKIYHLSSHLGDEFMLTKEGKKVKRINLSYEGIDAISSYYYKHLRIYGGGGFLVHKEPSFVKRGKIQAGLEYSSKSTYLNNWIRPVSGIDLKFLESNKWAAQISVKTGIQLENNHSFSKKIQLMFEYYKGNSIHGQFYKNKTEYFGIGLHSFI